MKAARPMVGSEVFSGDWFNVAYEYADGSGHFADEDKVREDIAHAMRNTERFHGISLGPVTFRLATPEESGIQPMDLKGEGKMLVGVATVIAEAAPND